MGNGDPGNSDCGNTVTLSEHIDDIEPQAMFCTSFILSMSQYRVRCTYFVGQSAIKSSLLEKGEKIKMTKYRKKRIHRGLQTFLVPLGKWAIRPMRLVRCEAQ